MLPIWGSTRANPRGRRLAELADRYNLSTLNDGTPTYLYGTEGSSCLDLTLVSRALTSQVTWFADIETHGSDHLPTYTTIMGFNNVRKTHFVKRTNWHRFEETLRNKVEEVTDLSDFVNAIVSCAETSTHAYNVPSTQTTIDAEYERLRAIRRRAERRSRRTRDVKDLRESRRVQKKIQRHFRKLARHRWRTLCENMDPRKRLCKIWKISRSLKSSPTQLHPFRSLALSRNCSEKDIANQFCISLTTYTTCCSKSSSRAISVPLSCEEGMDDLFTVGELDAALHSVKPHTSPGPDGVQYGFLKHMGENARDVLLRFYNSSWTKGMVPGTWKMARIVPLLKPGKSPLQLTSYRPVALASCVGKIMEKMIYRRLDWYLDKRDLYADTMQGFRRGRSSIDGVIDLVTYVEQEQHQRRITVAAFLNIKGAFDYVTHEAILQALREVGIGGRLYEWIRSYLTGRSIYMSTHDGDTPQHLVTRGVPQGGVLSPILFNITLILLAMTLPSTVKASFYSSN